MTSSTTCTIVHKHVEDFLGCGSSTYLYMRIKNKNRAGKVLYVEHVHILSNNIPNLSPNPDPNHKKLIP